jgi:hypothetical protein
LVPRQQQIGGDADESTGEQRAGATDARVDEVLHEGPS